jgi:cytochrome d ubiquinol oxidase subunit I
MPESLFFHRLQFAFTIVYHYLFPQLTMGLALIIAALKWVSLRTGDTRYADAARFWIRIFGINFAVGVVTGVPMEFQFGTNWAAFTGYAGGVIGQTLGMEGLFAFFLESSFLFLLVWGEKRLSARAHTAAACALWAGSWLSGYFIIATNAFMQHPVGYVVSANGSLQLDSFRALVLNRWAIAAYAHNMLAAVVTASFVVSAVGAYWALKRIHTEQARLNLAWGTTFGLVASLLVAFPTGDRQGKMVAAYQPITLAAMEGRFASGTYAEVNLIGQPNVEARTLDNPIRLPGILSFIAYGSFSSRVRGLNEFPRGEWPDNIELLYYSFHIMVGLGTIFIALMALTTFMRWRGDLHRARWLLWPLMLAFPFPYISTTAGWMTAELGRQPWLVYGLMRTADGASANVHSGTVLFTLMGFCGLYFVLGLLFVFLIGREIVHGPSGSGGPARNGTEAAHG